MFDTNELLTRLQNGETVESIAQGFADALNSANAELQKEKMAQNNKEKDTRGLVLNMIAYFGEYYPELYDAMFEDQSKDAMDSAVEDLMETVIQVCDELGRMMPHIRAMANAYSGFHSAIEPRLSVKMASPDEVLENWLKTLN